MLKYIHIINERSQIIDFLIIKGNVDDKQPIKNMTFNYKVFEKIFADRGYIGKDLFEELFLEEIHLVTKIKKNIKNTLMYLYDKILLRKRDDVVSVNEILKNQCQIKHTRHKILGNFFTIMVSVHIAFAIYLKNPTSILITHKELSNPYIELTLSKKMC